MNKLKILKLMARAGEVATTVANPLAAVSETLQTMSKGLTEMSSEDILGLTSSLVLERVVQEYGEQRTIDFLQHLIDEVNATLESEQRREAFHRSMSIEPVEVPVREEPPAHMQKFVGETEPLDDNPLALAGEWKILAAHIIKKEEGVVYRVYKDSKGIPHFGVGHKMDDEELEMYTIGERVSEELVDQEFRNDMLLACSQAQGVLTLDRVFEELSDVRKAVLTSMVFQLGRAGVRKFRKFVQCVAEGDHEGAAREMLDSKWARKDSPVRAHRHADMWERNEVVDFYKT